MNDEILDKLNKEISDHLDELSKRECGTEEMRRQINDLETLYQLRLKELEVQEKAKENQLKNELEMDRHLAENEQLRLKEMELQETAKENQFKNELEMNKHVADADNKAEQLKEQKKERRTKTALAIGKALGLAGAFFIGMRFEESGAICSKTVGKVIDKMIK